MFESISIRAYTDSGRFRRNDVYIPPPDGSEVITFIRGHEKSLLRLLSMMELRTAKEQVATLFYEDFGPWGGFMDDLFRIGGTVAENGVGLAVLPRARQVFKKEYPRATVLIPIQVTREANFVIFISKDRPSGQLDIAVGWTQDFDLKDWPQDEQIREDLLEKVVVVLDIIESLFIRHLKNVSA